jgi:hypothetical protein
MKVFILYTLYTSFKLRSLMWLSGGRCITKDIYRNITQVLGRMHRYKTLGFKNSTLFKIHIKDYNTDKNICD